MKVQILGLKETAVLIEQGRLLSIAGVESLLNSLPKGNWVGGTTPYLFGENGGCFSENQLLVTEFPTSVLRVKIRAYTSDHLANIPEHYPRSGFNFMVIPAFSRFHEVFGSDASSTKGLSNSPLIGWIAGGDLAPGKFTTPRVYDGQAGENYADRCVVMHAELDPQYLARVGVLNLFQPGKGPILEFLENSYRVRECKINGEIKNLFEYLNDLGGKLEAPLVASLFGSRLNVSFKELDAAGKEVVFYAPVQKGIHYRLAEAIPDYESSFRQFAEAAKLPSSEKVVWSSNCILNYLYGNLEGKKIPPFYGPVTFGEVAYYLLNQTLVYLTIESSSLK